MSKIFDDYTDPSVPGSFSGLSGFKKNTKYQNSLIKKLLSKSPVYTLHKPKILRFKRAKVWVSRIDEQWQVDLIDVKALKGSNFGKSYMFTCIDVFSKYAWVIPIKHKEAKMCKDALQEIIEKSKRKPSYIYLDNGKEFLGAFKKYCADNNITILPTQSDYKASVVERFNRTIKEKIWRVFTHNLKKKIKFPKNYTAFIENLVNSYNNSYHRTIKTAPSRVNKEN